MKRTDPEHWEKYALLTLAVMTGVQINIMAWVAVSLDTQAAAVLMGGFVIYGIAVLAALLLRKMSKYANLTRLKIGVDGVEIETEKESDDE